MIGDPNEPGREMHADDVACLVRLPDGREFYVLECKHAAEKLPELEKQLKLVVERQGVPITRFAARSVPFNDGKRVAVMYLLTPPEALRDAPLTTIENALHLHRTDLLRGLAHEIFRSYTSDPITADAARTLGEMATKHADSLKHKE